MTASALPDDALAVRWWFDSQGWGSVYPWGMWLWTGLTGFAATVLVVGWPASPWWRRVALLAAPACVLSAGTVLNVSLGYLPTAQTAWQRLTGRQSPQWIDQSALAQMRCSRGCAPRLPSPATPAFDATSVWLCHESFSL